MKTIEGKRIGEGLKFAVVAARFNDWVVSGLIEGALDGFVRHGVSADQVEVIRVPGAYEIPLATQRAVSSGKYDGIVTLGAVVRGQTPHFDYVCAEVSKGVAQVSMQSGLPVMFGVLTTDTMEQAMDRSGGKAGNKGFDAAVDAIEMVNLLKTL